MAARTNLIVPVPAAEAAVGTHREHLDLTAAQGVPAHISVLVGFVEWLIADLTPGIWTRQHSFALGGRAM